MVDFTVYQVIGGGTPEAMVFNYFFSLVSIFGVFAMVCGIMVRWLTRT